MKKMIFLKVHELANIISEELNVVCEIGVNETLKTDELRLKEDGITPKIMSIESTYGIVNKRFGVEVTSYDVIEVGDFGDGFVFFIK